MPPTDSQRDDAYWLALFEVLIPPDTARGMPSAALPAMLPAVRERLRAVAGMEAIVEASLDAIDARLVAAGGAELASLDLEAREAVMREADADQPMGLNALAFNVFATYYQQPEVLAALGLPGRAPFPEGFALDDDDEPWLAKARARAGD